MTSRTEVARKGLTATLFAFSAACGGDVAAPQLDQAFEIVFDDLSSIPATQGVLTVWVYDSGDTLAVGSIPATSEGVPVPDFRFTMPLERAQGVFLTVEPSPDPSPAPQISRILEGRFDGNRAALSADGAMTDGRPLQPDPGAHSLFTTSNNSEGYPSAENAGLWLFTLTPSRNVHGTREVKVTPLQQGWTYEGWLVWQGPPKVWISYGKFRPDEFSLLTSRDDSGSGPFAGTEDFRNAGVEDVPGEEWTSDQVAEQLGIQLPGGFDLPLAIDSVDATGQALWHHVISIEPSFDLVEGPLEGRPFSVRPYENAIGAGGPGVPRTILLARPLPSGLVRPRPDG